MLQIIPKRNIWLTISGLFVAVSIIALFVWGLNFGIDFTGGSLLELSFKESRPGIQTVQESMSDLELGSLIVQEVGESDMVLRFQDTSEEKHQEVLAHLRNIVDGEGRVPEEEIASSTETIASSTQAALNEESNLEELRFDSVGPTIGAELKSKSITAIIIVVIAIVIYIAWAFRKVSKPVASWKFGVTAIIALFHDVMITVGVFSFLGYYYGIEVNTPFVAAILTVLGYSVNDTIVVFDRVREQLPKSELDFEGTVNASVNQTISRSINTSLTTLLVLLSIVIFGGETIRDFVVALSVGVFVGTYSSIFLASPLLVIWERLGNRS